MAEETQQRPQELIAWEFLERPRYQRGRLWYLLMLLAGVGLLIYAVYSANFLFALIVIMFALVIYVTTAIEPRSTRFAVTENGLEIGERIYSYRDIDRFWFYYDPPIKSLYVHLRGTLAPRLKIDLVDQDPNAVREALNQFVPEDLEEVDEPLSDILSRLLKI